MELSKNEISIIVYLEACLVDSRGYIESVRMNDTDWKIMEEWRIKGLIDYGRRPFKDIRNRPSGTTAKTHWIKFSDQAWYLAHKCRRERGERYTATLEEVKK